MRRSAGTGVFVRSILLLVCAVPSLVCQAQQPAAAPAAAAAPVSYKPLTVDHIYSQPGLSGRLTRGIAWTPDSKQISFFESKGAQRTAAAAAFRGQAGIGFASRCRADYAGHRARPARAGGVPMGAKRIRAAFPRAHIAGLVRSENAGRAHAGVWQGNNR